MSIELTEPAIEPYEEFTVAGVAQRDTEVDVAELWAALDDFADDFGDTVVGEERYGVIFEVDGNGDEFTYVAGREVESTDDLSPELTGVEIPETPYAVFSMRGVDADEVVAEIDEGLLSDADYERADGPIFQRYAPTTDPTDPDAPFDLFVPIEGEYEEGEYAGDDYD